MMDTLVEMEGTWDQIQARAGDLEGKYIRLTATSEPPRSALTLQDALDHVRRIQAGMGPTRAGDTVGIIREGRAGAMYGVDPDE